MLTEAEKRAAEWVVARYGLDRGVVENLLESVLRTRAKGKTFDFFDALLRERLLPPSQINDLRLALDNTRINPLDPSNGQAAVNPMMARTEAPRLPREPELRGEPIPDLRTLGEYRLLRRLGEGGMGSVFLGYQEEKNEYVALKVLAANLAGNPTLLDRFGREGRSGAHLNHPNIVRNLGVGFDEAAGLHYLVLEYVDGPSGLELLERYGRLFVADAVHVVLDIARALEHAHSRNLIHRDIKPGNILITQSGMAKLADLGLAKRTDETSTLTHTRQTFGTPYYMPYEQALNAKYADVRSDLYALGATFYHFLVGEVPFQGANSLEVVEKKNVGIFTPASVLNSDVPAVLDRIVERMLARDPADRYQTASELIVDLERSNLAASVPSFIDPDKALQDPQMRQRLLSPPPPTEHDLQSHPAAPPIKEPSATALWYLRYHDRHGQLCKSKKTLEEIVERLRHGSLSAETEASPKPNGDFCPLSSFPEFAAALAEHAKAEGRSHHAKRRARAFSSGPYPTWWWYLPLLVAAVILLLVALTVWFVSN